MGVLILIESIFLLFMVFIPLFYNENDARYFLISSLISAVFGGMFFLLGRKAMPTMGKHEGAVIITIVWIIFTLFGMLPYWLSGSIPSFTDAFFETISGFTTVGATVLKDVESLSHGMLFWRSFTHFVGGIGIIMLSITILPFFGIRGNQLTTEASSVKRDKIHAKISETIKRLFFIYICLNIFEIVLLFVGGMDLFDAVCLSFSTIATGGFSTKNNSIAYWNSPFIQYVIAIFMLLSGINFVIYYFGIKGKFSKIKENEEFRYYLILFVIFAAVVIVSQIDFSKEFNFANIEKSFRNGFFTTASLMTTTAFGTVDYLLWKPAIVIILLFVMIVGGSAGSTSGGLKIIRLVMAVKTCYYQFKRIVHPNAVIPVRYNNSLAQNETVTNILTYILLYLIVIWVGSLILSFAGFSLQDAFGTIVSCLSGVGAGISVAGPFGSYADISLFGKWFLSFVMLLGRLELFTVLLLFTPIFWRN